MGRQRASKGGHGYQAWRGVTLPLRNTRGRCRELRHHPTTGAALRPSSVFLLHVGTRDGGGSGGGCAWMGAGARDGALVPEVRDEGGREAGGSGDPSLPGAWLTPAALVGAGRGGGARRAAAAGAVPG